MIETASIRGECSLDAAALQRIYNFYLIDTVILTYYIPAQGAYQAPWDPTREV